jgi:hypothetical protein
MRTWKKAAVALGAGLVWLTTAAAGGAASIRIQVIDYGLYHLAAVEGGSWPTSGPGRLQVSLMHRPYLRSTVVPLKAGTVFGLSFVVKSTAPGPASIRVVVDAPPVPADSSGRQRYVSGRLPVLAGRLQHVLIRLTAADVAGVYRVRLFDRGILLASREFQVK